MLVPALPNTHMINKQGIWNLFRECASGRVYPVGTLAESGSDEEAQEWRLTRAWNWARRLLGEISPERTNIIYDHIDTINEIGFNVVDGEFGLDIRMLDEADDGSDDRWNLRFLPYETRMAAVYVRQDGIQVPGWCYPIRNPSGEFVDFLPVEPEDVASAFVSVKPECVMPINSIDFDSLVEILNCKEGEE